MSRPKKPKTTQKQPEIKVSGQPYIQEETTTQGSLYQPLGQSGVNAPEIPLHQVKTTTPGIHQSLPGMTVATTFDEKSSTTSGSYLQLECTIDMKIPCQALQNSVFSKVGHCKRSKHTNNLGNYS